ncbi:single-stranded DNA-binding protein [Subtercola frigoramans]|uniref:Single-stranded DNA-binding protein n=1 Tax=Subtercola frigoramans TaxID=120298 RepID=A0ABS2L0E8_9MICO|nr:single-stranded DNA-binding protein [Subtercola frigoramans]MBM7470543.1 single-strand DNA-binding protein [Subtercola frigoramans]
MNDTITVTGIIATTPRSITTDEGLAISSFRLASMQRRYNSASKEAREETNWYTVTTFRALAEHVAASLNKGDHVIVTGSVHIRDWDNDGKTGTTVEIEANNAGPDLVFGTSLYTKTPTANGDTVGAEPVGDSDNPF